MKLINNKYKIKPIQIEGNRKRLIDSMNSNILARFPGKLKDIPKPISSLKNKVTKNILDALLDKHLMYSNEIILNHGNCIVVIWFKHCGSSNISLVISKGMYNVYFKDNNSYKLKGKETKSSLEAITKIKEVLDSFPDLIE